MVNDKHYRELVDHTSLHYNFYINVVRPNLNTDYQQLLWLRLLGLVETWDMRYGILFLRR